MATNEPFEQLAKIAEQTMQSVRGVMENSLAWFQKSSSVAHFGGTDLGKKLVRYATENTTAAFAFLNKLNQAKNVEDVVKIQTEFVETQLKVFNERLKEFTDAAVVATKTRLDESS